MSGPQNAKLIQVGNYSLIGIQDSNNALALGTTQYYQTTSGLLVAAPVDENNNPIFSLAGSNVTLANAVTSTGVVAANKTAVGLMKNYVFEVWGTATSFTINIQAVGPSGTPRNLPIFDEIGNAYISGNFNLSTAGLYSVSLQPFTNLQANVPAISGGNVNIVGGMTQ